MEIAAAVKTLPLRLSNCAKCNEILVMPIMTINNLGNVCEPCYNHLYKISDTLPALCVKDGQDDNRITKGDVVRSTENIPLKEYFECMSIQCSYKGCPEIIRFVSMRNHKEQCLYNNFNCTVENCQWQGKEKQFLAHFQDCHRENIIDNEDDVFDVSFPSGSKDFTALIKTSFGEFMCRIGVTEDAVKFILYDVDQFKYGPCYETHVICKLNATEMFIIIDKLSKEMRALLEFEGKEVVKHTLPKSADQEKGFPCFSIRFILNGYEMKVNNSLADVFKCNMCSNYSQQLLKICSRQHIVCSSCARPDGTCPVGATQRCAQSVSDCAHLNRLLPSARLPCTNVLKGCKVKSFPKSNHLTLCRYQ